MMTPRPYHRLNHSHTRLLDFQAETTTKYLFLNVNWEKYCSTLPLIYPGAIPKLYHNDGNKLVRLFREKIRKFYVR